MSMEMGGLAKGHEAQQRDFRTMNHREIELCRKVSAIADETVVREAAVETSGELVIPGPLLRSRHGNFRAPFFLGGASCFSTAAHLDNITEIVLQTGRPSSSRANFPDRSDSVTEPSRERAEVSSSEMSPALHWCDLTPRQRGMLSRAKRSPLRSC